MPSKPPSTESTASEPTFSRRTAIKAGATAALAAPMFIPGSALGQDGRPAPSERVVMGCIGVGWQGTGNMENFLKHSICQVVAVCDVDTQHLANAKSIVDKAHGNSDCKTYADFREVIARTDIDALSLGLPDHWHAIPAIMGMKAGKHVWGEKPLAHTLGEGRAIADTWKQTGKVWQTGSWQRSVFNFYEAAMAVANGRIGKVHKVEVGLPSGWSDFANTRQFDQPSDPPAELDYETWIGPAEMEPYIKARHHKNWRWNYNIGGGQLMDWIGHHNDIAHWALGLDGSAPTRVTGYAHFPDRSAVWNTAPEYVVISQYADDLEIEIRNAPNLPRNKSAEVGFWLGTKWIGADGWVHVDRGKLSASKPEIVDSRKMPYSGSDKQLMKSDDHFLNFLQASHAGDPKATITNADLSQRAVAPGHLGLISAWLGRSLEWDDAAGKVKNDDAANAMLGRKYRAPWSLEVA